MNSGTAKSLCVAADAATMVTTTVTAMGRMAHPVIGLVDAAALGAVAAAVVSLGPATCA